MNIPAPLLGLLQKLPETPPAFALVSALNLVRSTLWPDEDFSWLTGRQVRMQVTDLGVGLTLSFNGSRFVVGETPADVTFAANVADYWLIARRQEDPDTLFFQRRLTIAGDTELGLQLKNLMDATDFSPLLARLPQPLRQRFSV